MESLLSFGSQLDRILLLILLIIIGCLLPVILRHFRIPDIHRQMFFIAFIGTALRILYIAVTPYSMRSYDWADHLLYIQYVAAHFSIPPASAGWEFHQAPLYYIVTGSLYRLGESFGLSHVSLINELQLFSFLCSLVMLFIALQMAIILFPQPHDAPKRLLFGMLIAVWPSLIMMSARIGNDVLYQPLAAAVLLFLLMWWHKKDMRWWYVACVCFSLGFLTKISMLALLPVLIFSFIAYPHVSAGKRLRSILLSCIMILALTAWLPAYRFFVETDATRVLTLGNGFTSPGLQSSNAVEHLLTFNPVKVLEVPYNNTWDNAARRMYFPEFFYKSIFFGEFQFGDALTSLSTSILFLGFIAMIFCCLGFIKDIARSWTQNLPLWSSTICLITSVIAYRVAFPYVSNQDFRFITVAIIPLSYYAVAGADVFGRSAKYGRLCLWLLACSCGAFAFMIYLLS